MSEKASENTVKTVLIRQAGVMEETYKDYQNNPYNPHTTHQLRVSMRTMRALLNFLKPVLNENEYDDLNNQMRDAANHLGPLREVDVLIEEGSDLALEEPDAIEFYADLFKLLHVERRKLLRSRTTKRSHDILGEAVSIADNLSRLEMSLASSGEESWRDFITNRFNKKTEKLKEQYKETDHEDYEASHEVRKQAKKVRYSAAGFKKWLEKDKRKTAEKKAKNIQTELGVISDLHVNAQMLKEYSEKAAEEELREAFLELARLQEKKRTEITAD